MAAAVIYEIEGVARKVGPDGKGRDEDVKFALGNDGVARIELLGASSPTDITPTCRVHYADGRQTTEYMLRRPSTVRAKAPTAEAPKDRK